MKFFFTLFFFSCFYANAQQIIFVKAINRSNNGVIGGATILIDSNSKAITNNYGVAFFQLNRGVHNIKITSIGFANKDSLIMVPLFDTLIIGLSEAQRHWMKLLFYQLPEITCEWKILL
ncbi:MAG: hypothetical protein IT248_02770 [Chitinophagaceae bacterium]|nr:hypothetical protein [Chitinophagaceae bacterium]HND95467.1 hypothetical protein [Chitinophagaceae bacterium]HNO54932.1 hypothetical protein [Chitinophagaceae bacterium]HRF25138.1 hypothetical protein [Chitinophagaceae bacterium]